jgi:hypothetical protein
MQVTRKPEDRGSGKYAIGWSNLAEYLYELAMTGVGSKQETIDAIERTLKSNFAGKEIASVDD